MTIGKIMGSHQQSYTTDLLGSDGKHKGSITIKLEKVATNNDMVHFEGHITGLPSKRFL